MYKVAIVPPSDALIVADHQILHFRRFLHLYAIFAAFVARAAVAAAAAAALRLRHEPRLSHQRQKDRHGAEKATRNHFPKVLLLDSRNGLLTITVHP